MDHVLTIEKTTAYALAQLREEGISDSLAPSTRQELDDDGVLRLGSDLYNLWRAASGTQYEGPVGKDLRKVWAYVVDGRILHPYTYGNGACSACGVKLAGHTSLEPLADPVSEGVQCASTPSEAQPQEGRPMTTETTTTVPNGTDTPPATVEGAATPEATPANVVPINGKGKKAKATAAPPATPAGGTDLTAMATAVAAGETVAEQAAPAKAKRTRKAKAEPKAKAQKDWSTTTFLRWGTNSRKTGASLGMYNADHPDAAKLVALADGTTKVDIRQAPGEGRWVVLDRNHGSTFRGSNMDKVYVAMFSPEAWCAECTDIAAGKADKLVRPGKAAAAAPKAAGAAKGTTKAAKGKAAAKGKGKAASKKATGKTTKAKAPKAPAAPTAETTPAPAPDVAAAPAPDQA